MSQKRYRIDNKSFRYRLEFDGKVKVKVQNKPRKKVTRDFFILLLVFATPKYILVTDFDAELEP